MSEATDTAQENPEPHRLGHPGHQEVEHASFGRVGSLVFAHRTVTYGPWTIDGYEDVEA